MYDMSVSLANECRRALFHTLILMGHNLVHRLTTRVTVTDIFGPPQSQTEILNRNAFVTAFFQALLFISLGNSCLLNPILVTERVV